MRPPREPADMNDRTPDGEPRHSEDQTSTGDGPRPALARSREDRFIGGVAAGLGRYLGVDPLFVRLAFLLTVVLGGVGVLAYLVLLAAMPMEGDPDVPAPAVTGSRRGLVISGALLFGALLVIATTSGDSGTSWLFGFGFGVVFGILLWVATAVALLWVVRAARRGRDSVPGGGAASVAVESTPAPPATPAGPPAGPARPGLAASPSQNAPTGTAATEVMQQPGERRSGPATVGRIMIWVAIGLAALFGFFTVAAISTGLTVAFGAIPAAAAVMLCGVAIVWLALAGRPAISIWLVGAAVAIAIPMAAVTVAGLDVDGDWGDIRHAPTSAGAVPDDGYKLGAGAMRVDLRDFPFRKGEPLRLETESGFGATEVIVPDDVCVTGDVQSGIGFIDMRGEETSGVDAEARTDRPAPGARVLKLDSEFKLGYFGVRDATSHQVDRVNSDDADWSTERTNSEQADARRRAEDACSPPPRRDPKPRPDGVRTQ